MLLVIHFLNLAKAHNGVILSVSSVISVAWIMGSGSSIPNVLQQLRHVVR